MVWVACKFTPLDCSTALVKARMPDLSYYIGKKWCFMYRTGIQEKHEFSCLDQLTMPPVNYMEFS